MPPKASMKEELLAPAEIVFERTEQEEQCDGIFKELDKAFKKLHKTSKPDRIHNQIKEITTKLKLAKGLIKDFEREARADGMAVGELAARKKAMATELNNFIQLKSEFANIEGSKADLLTGAGGEIEMGVDGMSMQQLMVKGRKDIAETDKALDRGLRIVQDTRAVAIQVAEAVDGQTKQLEKIVDDLNEIEFTMKKASKVIGDITRGLLTDKCIAFLLLLVVVGVVAIIVVKIINPNRKKVQEGAQAIVANVTTAINNTDIGSSAISGATNAANSASNAVGRRVLVHKALVHLLELNATL